MPRYFFHVDDGDFVADETGTALESRDAARTVAVQAAAEVLADLDGKFWNAGDAQWRMHVTDEAGTLMFTLRFAADVPSGEVEFLPRAAP